jgi:hypothetical protein
MHPALVLGEKNKEFDLTPRVKDERRTFSCKILSEATIIQLFHDGTMRYVALQ